jgi:flagellar protein FliS
LQTCLDFDKAPEIAGNLFQLYEFARQKVISSFTKKDTDGINQATAVIREILDGWQSIPMENRNI